MDWFTLTIILAFIASTLVLSMRAITPETNPFLFMAIVTGLASVSLVLYCMFSGISLSLGRNAAFLALLAGLSVTALDLGLIFMFRKGATVAVSMPLFRVCSIVISALMGFVLFREGVNPVKMAGIVLACIAVYLLNSKPKGDLHDHTEL
ncbi:MAG: hypothetical protein JWM96_1054 [Alphaproteobacteria bacterium]|nr:hypothetical protein [Alphaproteobacteria bacterium]